MRYRTFLLAVASIILSTTRLLHAESPTVTSIPQGWNPNLDAAVEWMRIELDDATGQMQVNSISRAIADMKDVELFVIYFRLSEHLTTKQRKSLGEAQAQWLKERAKYVESAIDSRGGSLAAYEASQAEIKFTEARIKELREKLSLYED